MVIHTAIFDDQDGRGNIPDKCYNLVLWLLVGSVEAGDQPEPNHTFPDLFSFNPPFVSAYRGDPQTCGGRPACRINPTRVAVRGVPF